MRILFLSNFYPPARAGGYAQLCQEVALRLEARKHDVCMLTSRYDRESVSATEKRIYRELHLEGDLFFYRPLDLFTRWRQRNSENQETLRRIISHFKPDVIMVWGMWALSHALPATCEKLLPGRVVYYLADYWPTSGDMHTAYWTKPTRRWIFRPTKRVLGTVALAMLANGGRTRLQFEHVLCVSSAVREILIDQGLPIQHACVVHNGIEVKDFAQLRGSFPSETNPLRMLYAGQLVRHKGVHTAIKAVAKIVNELNVDGISLTILGAGHPSYEEFLHDLADNLQLQDHVRFWKPVPRDRMPSVLREFDVLVLPSTYDEPLARITQEAMAAGLVVVGTTTGGTKEILAEGENGLTFAPEDIDGLTEQLVRLIQDRELCRQLAEAGRRTVLEDYNLDQMVDKIEKYLEGVVTSPARALPILSA